MRDGRGGRDALAILEARARLRPSGAGELDPQLARLGADLDGEAGVAEHLHHPMVLGEHDRGEGVDAVGGGQLGEMGEQDRCDTTPVPVVGDLERHLGPLGRLADVRGVRDDPLRLARDRDEPAASPGSSARHVRGGGAGRRRR